MVLKLECASEYPGGFLKTQISGLSPRVFDPVGLVGVGPFSSISLENSTH